MPQKVIPLDEVEVRTSTHGEHYEWKRQRITSLTGLNKLGCSVYEIPPGKRAFAYHYHHANEELFFVMDGEGIVRTPDGELSVRSGDFVAAVTGEDGAHQLINNSDKPLRYLAVSTMIEPEVVEYKDSKKMFIMAGAAPGGEKHQRKVNLIFKQADATDYWDSEPE